MLIDPENYFAEFAFCGNTFAAAIQSCLLLKTQAECEPAIPMENLHAIATVTLSLAAAEGFINELGYHCGRYRAVEDGKQERQFGELWKLAEKGNGSITHKFDMANLCFRGQPCSYGEEPFQSFDLLIKVRNALVHCRTLRADVADGEVKNEPKVERALESRSLLRGSQLGWAEDWRMRALNRECGVWALRTAAAVVNDVLEAPQDLQAMGFQVQEYRDVFVVPTELAN